MISYVSCLVRDDAIAVIGRSTICAEMRADMRCPMALPPRDQISEAMPLRHTGSMPMKRTHHRELCYARLRSGASSTELHVFASLLAYSRYLSAVTTTSEAAFQSDLSHPRTIDVGLARLWRSKSATTKNGYAASEGGVCSPSSGTSKCIHVHAVVEELQER